MPNNNLTRKQISMQPSVSLPAGSLRILQVTDSHLYADPAGCLVGINTQQSFDSVMALARERLPRTDLVLATGDLVHDASPEGYRRLRGHLNNHGVPVYCLSRNHDVPAVMAEHMRGGRVAVERTVRRNGWLIVMLDSTIIGEEGGHLAESELAALEQELSKHPECHVLVCLHHHPVPINSAWMDSIALDNPEQLFAVLDNHPSIRGILWGHIHQQFDAQRRGVKLMGSPSTCIQFTPDQDQFGIDSAAPGLRWLELLPNGIIHSGLMRLDEIPVGLDLRAAGY